VAENIVQKLYGPEKKVDLSSSIEWKLSGDAIELSSLSMVSRYGGKVPFQNELDE
jgi:hypothetical protein